MRRPKRWVVRFAPPTSTPSSQARWNNALSGAERLNTTSVASSIWTEDRDHSAHPVVAAPLQKRRTQALGSRLQSAQVAHRQESVVGFAESHFFTCQFLGNERVTVEIAR